MAVGRLDREDFDIRNAPSQIVLGADAPCGDPLMEIAAGEERVDVRVGHGSHGCKLDGREVGRFVNHDLVARQIPRGQQCGIAGILLVARDRSVPQQRARCPEHRKEQDVLERRYVGRSKPACRIPAPLGLP